MQEIKCFKFWCQKVLPVVYDDSLSYYELLCKVVKYINDLIDSDKEIIQDITQLKKELRIVQKWIEDFNTDMIEKWLADHLFRSIFVRIDNGYFMYYLPEGWQEITLFTSGLDIDVENVPFGHLIIDY